MTIHVIKELNTAYYYAHSDRDRASQNSFYCNLIEIENASCDNFLIVLLLAPTKNIFNAR